MAGIYRYNPSTKTANPLFDSTIRIGVLYHRRSWIPGYRILIYDLKGMKSVDIKAGGKSGTDKKSDCVVSVEPSDAFELCYEGTNASLYGKSTEAIVKDVLAKYDIKGAKVSVSDKGALKLVIRARTEIAVERALGRYCHD